MMQIAQVLVGVAYTLDDSLITWYQVYSSDLTIVRAKVRVIVVEAGEQSTQFLLDLT